MGKKILAGRKIVVLGMGSSGMSMARFLSSNRAAVSCHDLRPIEQWDRQFVSWAKDHGVELYSGQRLPEKLFSSGLELAVSSPGIPTSATAIKELKEKGVRVIGDLALSAVLWSGPLVGITGTNGKTTTTRLITHLLKESGIEALAAGNISPPLSEAALNAKGTEVAVLEISSFQLEYFPEKGAWPLELDPPRFQAALWLNLASDHLDRHPDMESYGSLKAHLFDFLAPGSLAVLRQELVRFVKLPEDATVVLWPEDIQAIEEISHGPELKNQRYFAHIRQKSNGTSELIIELPGLEKESYDISHWQLLGLHNIQNLAFALAAAKWLGADRKRLQQAISSFKAPEHRLQEIGRIGSIAFIDDSKATNVAATASALTSLKHPVVLIAGGSYKAEDFTPLKELIYSKEKGYGIRAAVLLGEEAERIAKEISPLLSDCSVINYAERKEKHGGFIAMKEAVKRAFHSAQPGDSVLLSPACASFDLFSGYRERAAAFRQAFKELKAAVESGEFKEGIQQ